jgi:hypothetical protein
MIFLVIIAVILGTIFIGNFILFLLAGLVESNTKAPKK